jgi:catechol 2,3-dioxygenase-like lactoylglutathione lyase family enzyme
VLQHVSIEIPPEQVDRATEFWTLVGFREVEPPRALGGYVRWLERQGTQIHLILSEAHTAPVLGHPAIVVSDHPATVEALRKAGFEVEEARELWGAARAFAIAPGGHRVELMAAPPPTGAASASSAADPG